MSICAYCKRDSTLTREHLIPDWYIKLDWSPNDLTFLERTPQRFIESDPVVRDVCAMCNSGPLSELDAYGRTVYASALGKFIYRGENFTLPVEYTVFVKWLLKSAYNSARIHKTDLHILDEYAALLISDLQLPASLHVYVATVAPGITGKAGKPAMATRPRAAQASDPSWFRVGVFRVPGFDSIQWSFRHIAINSFCFSLFVPAVRSPAARAEEASLLAAVAASDLFGVELRHDAPTPLAAPAMDAFTYALSHIAAFPFAYNVLHSPIAKRVIAGECKMVHYIITREDIEARDSGSLLDFLTDITSSPEIARGFAGKVEFSVSGYVSDPRGLYEVPEVRRFLAGVDKLWPYWVMFQHPGGSWLRILALCLCDSERASATTLSFDNVQLGNLLGRWYGHLNELCHSCLVTMEINRELSESAARIVHGPRT